MFFQTLASRAFSEARWLRAWSIEEKKAELYNTIVSLCEKMIDQRINVENSYFVFYRKSYGVFSYNPAGRPEGTGMIAIVKPIDSQNFRQFWQQINASEYIPRNQQESVLDPIVENVFQQVYGARDKNRA